MNAEIEAEKQRLVLECACDRLHWKVQRLRSERQARGRGWGGEVWFWLNQVDRLAGPYLPRWWRTSWMLLRRLR